MLFDSVHVHAGVPGGGILEAFVMYKHGHKLVAAGLTLAAVSLAGCSLAGGDVVDDNSLTIVTYDSFAVSDAVLERFTKETGISVNLVAAGSGGEMVNRLLLTKDSPLGDVAYGVTDAFASRAVTEGIFEDYAPAGLPESASQYLIGEALTPVDLSDICMNVDLSWFETNNVPVPKTLDDLVLPEYKNLSVVPSPVTSSPGLGFLLKTIDAKGEDGWLSYWESLKNNGIKVVDSWSDAYYVDFSASGEDGERPIVLSYASSPPFILGEDGQPTTEALLDTCIRQVEYAGILKGTSNPEGARKLVDFFLSESFQADIPGQMYMYPIDPDVPLPKEWAAFAPLAPSATFMAPEDIDAGRQTWIETWTESIQ